MRLQQIKSFLYSFTEKLKKPVKAIAEIFLKKCSLGGVSIFISGFIIYNTYKDIKTIVYWYFPDILKLDIISIFVVFIVFSILAIIIFKIFEFLISFVFNFCKTQYQDVKNIWYRNKNPDYNKKTNLKTIKYINYQQAIDIIKCSIYALYKKYNMINKGIVFDTGGHTRTEKTGFASMMSATIEVYTPTTEEAVNVGKIMLLYDTIFQEFYGSEYLKSEIRVESVALETFLRTKKIEIQQSQIF